MKRKAGITPVELARRRGVSLDWIYRQLWLRKIPAVRRGRRWVILASAADTTKSEADRGPDPR